jgi:hypothetical protein
MMPGLCSGPSSIEPVFGQIKKIFGFIGFMRRGLRVVQSEWAFICAGFNLKKLYRARPDAITAQGDGWLSFWPFPTPIGDFPGHLHKMGMVGILAS